MRSEKVCLLALLLFASSVLLMATAPSASAVLIGVNESARIPTEEDWPAIKRSGASFYQMGIVWKEVNDAGNWREGAAWEATYDKRVELAAKNEVSLVGGLYGRGTEAGETQYYLSSEWGEWLEFVAFVIGRYGRGGTFWSSHPSLPYRPITIWSVWNEPNFAGNTPGGSKPLPQKYAEFLIATSNQIKATQNAIRKAGEPSDTKVLHAGLYQWDKGMSVWEFLQKASGIPGYAASFDGLGLHPYSFAGSEAEKLAGLAVNMDNARTALNEFVSTTKPIWITELGWPVGGEGEPAVSEEEQARLLTNSFNWLKEKASYYKLELITWYFYRDTGGASWDNYCGLRRQDGSFRASWPAFQAQTGAAAWPAPSVETQSAIEIQETQATLRGTVNPNARSTTYRFEYGPTTSYGNSVPAPEGNAGSGSASVAVSATALKLQPHTHYHYRLVATNSAGTSYGQDQTFTTGLKWVLHDTNGSTGNNTTFWFGLPGETAVVGDWNGDGIATPGVYNPTTGVWKLRNFNSEGPAEITVQYGGSQFKPVVGDWDGNGTTTIGLYEPIEGRWELRNSNSEGPPNLNFTYGGSQFKPVVGDWDANGTTTIGLYEPNEGRWELRNTNGSGPPNLNFTYGGSQYKPMVGDWDGNGTTTIGLYEPTSGSWALRNTNGSGNPDLSFQFGGSQFNPIVGDWDGIGGETVGLTATW